MTGMQSAPDSAPQRPKLSDLAKKAQYSFNSLPGIGGGFSFDELLMDRVDEISEEDLQDILTSKFGIERGLIKENGEVDRQALKDELTLEEKIGVLAAHWIDENLGEDVLANLFKNFEVGSYQMAERAKRLSDNGIATLTDRGNAIWRSSAFMKVLGLAQLSVKDAEKPQLELMKQTTFVVSRREKLPFGLHHTNWTGQLKRLLKQNWDIELSVLDANSTEAAPGSNELHLVLASESPGLQELKSLYANVYERGGANFFNAQVSAAMLLLEKGDPSSWTAEQFSNEVKAVGPKVGAKFADLPGLESYLQGVFSLSGAVSAAPAPAPDPAAPDAPDTPDEPAPGVPPADPDAPTE